jgi:hypothetical protein
MISDKYLPLRVLRSLGLHIIWMSFLFLTSGTTISQSKCWEGGLEKDPGMKLIVRGKIFGFVLLEDVYVATGTLGLEYRFAKRHSIGSDVAWTKYWNENDSSNVVTGEEYASGFWQHDTRLNFNVDYRFYFYLKSELRDFQGMYLSASHRRGTMKWRSCEDYEFVAGEDIQKDAEIRDFGLALGYRLGGGFYKRWGLDTSFGMARRAKTEDYERYISLAQTDIVLDRKTIRWIPVFRFNVTYSFIRPKHLRPSKEPDISE